MADKYIDKWYVQFVCVCMCVYVWLGERGGGAEIEKDRKRIKNIERKESD